jgi:hypothetical protein
MTRLGQLMLNPVFRTDAIERWPRSLTERALGRSANVSGRAVSFVSARCAINVSTRYPIGDRVIAPRLVGPIRAAQSSPIGKSTH